MSAGPLAVCLWSSAGPLGRMTLGGGNSRRLDRQTRSLIILGLSGPCFHPDPGSGWHSLRFFGVFTFSLPCSPLSEKFSSLLAMIRFLTGHGRACDVGTATKNATVPRRCPEVPSGQALSQETTRNDWLVLAANRISSAPLGLMRPQR